MPAKGVQPGESKRGMLTILSSCPSESTTQNFDWMVAILMIALRVGANTAIFSALDHTMR
jgi:hypothetical protein